MKTNQTIAVLAICFSALFMAACAERETIDMFGQPTYELPEK